MRAVIIANTVINSFADLNEVATSDLVACYNKAGKRDRFIGSLTVFG
ncbi:hypothetical protein [Pseudomonas matsuisoli]|nr:hypothetical protein [Pseudomonas matsuisoli]